ncbi:PREDICTED: putative F-box protein At4g21240 [Camelina sativa]|uniref:F-box protein At4g21240 n=1 Tax=Camelina sativa TaxID=90675 RepID=A0ABM0SYG4_CAMSA|nr:PREDICTED: putative F-box protein At4g21240 [Camelina sativa]
MIPIDLIHDILLRLPAKSAARFRCVSKLWLSITTRQDFISSFTSRHSSTRLCLLLCVEKGEKRLFNSIPQLEHPDKTFNPYVERYEISAPKFVYYEGSEQSVHGLICLRDFDGNIVVWNPTTRQHVYLPKPQPNFIAVVSSFLGYDPVEHKYKVLCIPVCSRYQDLLVFTLGPQESWRVPQNSLYHESTSTSGIKGICINGHVYYEASIRFIVDGAFKTEAIVMSFDVRYEKFNVIKKPVDDELGNLFINYKG